jgi:tRNA nucleotidyltransferase (CCA-adding enzyme)
MGELASNLSNRDFTINAMAMTLGEDIIDPLKGINDLKLRLLRTCSAQTFNADPLRIFRALRFEADGWEMVHDTELLIREHDWSRTWSDIPIERFSREMLKALQLIAPAKFFQRMLELRTCEEYLPELFRMPHIPAGPLIHHPEGDLFTHSLEVLQRVAVTSNDPLTRFCAFFHDIGKLATHPVLYPRHHGHDQAGFELSKEFCRRLRLPAQYGKALSWISRLHGTFNMWGDLRDSTKLRVAEQAIKAGIVDVLPLVASADKVAGCEPNEWRMTIETALMTSSKLGLDRERLERVPSDKRAGVLLQARIDKLRSMVKD